MTRKTVDQVTYEDVGGEEVSCPECGWPAELWEDPHGWGYHCHNLTCMAFDELGSLNSA